MKSLLSQLFGQRVVVEGESESDEFGDELRAELDDLTGIRPTEPRECQHCGRTMRGPLCPHCGEWQVGYDYDH